VDTTICGNHIPARTRLLLLLREAGLHDGEDAGKFDPERWFDERDEQSAPKSLAFGQGPSWPGIALMLCGLEADKSKWRCFGRQACLARRWAGRASARASTQA
jgi:hypothetical protein